MIFKCFYYIALQEGALICTLCGKEINHYPCFFCGNQEIIKLVTDQDDASGPDELVRAPSTVIIDKEGHKYDFSFPENVSSGTIVTATLDSTSLTTTTPAPVQTLLIQNINQIEQYAKESKEQITDEISFEINLGILKFRYTRYKKSGS
jgi:hypothetical protein